MDHAIVLACGSGFAGEDLGSCAKANVAQVPQLKRIIINAQRAGINKFIVCSDGNTPDLKEILDSDDRITGDITWMSNGDSSNAELKPSIVIPSNLIINSSSLEEFIKSAEENDNSLSVLSSSGNGNHYGSKNLGNSTYGLVSASGKDIEKLLKKPDLKEWISLYVDNENVDFVNTETGYWMNIANNSESINKAEKLIFSTVGKTATGWIARNINGRISLPISKHLIKTGLTPNMISVLINVIGMLCGPFYALGHPVIGAVFMQIATVLDRCDGEVARIKLMETKKGQWVDTLSDQLTVLSFIIGSSVGYYYHSGSSFPLILGGINLFIFIFFLVWLLYFISKYTDSGSLVAYFRVDEIVDPEDTSVIRKIIAFLRPLSRRNVYSVGFLVLAIIGGYPLVVGVLTFALILFFLHQVEDIIKIHKLNN